MHMEEDNFNLEGLYNQLKEEEPFPWKAKCLSCGKDILTEARVSYQPQKEELINIYRPAHCPECEKGLKKVEVKVFGAINKEGDLHVRNKKGEIK